jgi:hypothetical protein
VPGVHRVDQPKPGGQIIDSRIAEQNVQIRLFQGLEYRSSRNPVMIPSLMFIIPIVYFVGLF